MPLPAVAATCDGAAAVPLAGKPCGKAGSLSRLCSKGCILRLDFLSTKIVINSQGGRKGTPLLYTCLASRFSWYSRGVPLRPPLYPCPRPIYVPSRICSRFRGNLGNYASPLLALT